MGSERRDIEMGKQERFLGNSVLRESINYKYLERRQDSGIFHSLKKHSLCIGAWLGVQHTWQDK